MGDIFDTTAAANAQAPPTPPQSAPSDIFDQVASGKRTDATPPTPQANPGFFASVYQGAKNWLANEAMQPIRQEQAASDLVHGRWHDLQAQARDAFITGAGLNPQSFESNPNPETMPNAGLWDKTKAVASFPILTTFHRKGSGPIESEAEDWLTGQANPLNVGIAAATMGTGLAESALTKLGLNPTTASAIVHGTKTAANLGFLTSQGFAIGKAVPIVERDYQDVKAATNDDEKQEAIDKLKRDGTDLTLSTLATGLASKGVEDDIRARMANSPRGKAMAVPQYAQAIHDYQAEAQIGNAAADQFAKEGAKAAPNAVQREGITNAIEAGDDPFVLASRAAESAKDVDAARGKKLAKGYEAAQNLSPLEKTLQQRIQKIHGDYLDRLQDAGLLPDSTSPQTPQQIVQGAGAQFVGQSNGVVEAKLPRSLTENLPIDDRFKNAVSISIPEKGLTPEAVRAAISRKLAEMGGEAPGTASPITSTPPSGPTFDPAKYIHHAYDFEDVNPATGEPVEGSQGSKDFLRKRSFANYFDAERAGMNPKTKDAVALTVDYIEKANAAIARQNLGNNLANANSVDGAPLGVAGGVVAGNYVIPDIPHDAPVPQADLQRLGGMNGARLNDLMQKGRVYEDEDGKLFYRFDDYRDSGLKTNRYIGNDADGKPMFARVPLYVAPEIAEHLRNVLDTSAPRGILGAALKASSLAKSSLLALSPFHWNTIFNRALEIGADRKTAFAPKPIDYFNLTDSQKAALRDGLVVTNTRPGRSGFLESEGLSSGGGESPLNKGINAALQKLGLPDEWANRLNVNHLLESKLFGPQGYITRLKFQMYDALKPEIQKTYPNLSDTQAGRIAASQINNKFGGLNYTLLGRSLGSQSAIRALTLAPDFLESTGRSMLDTIGPYGRPLLKRMMQFELAHYLLARVANYATTGQLHPETGFSVLSPDGKKEYSLRSTLGDFLHFVEDPRGFGYNRLNPLLVRTPLEAFYGIDQYGRRLSDDQRLTNIAREITPISLQGPLSKVFPSIYGNTGVAEPSATDQVAKSFGLGTTTRLTPAEQLALEKLSGRGGGVPQEGAALANHQARFRLEDRLRAANHTGDPFQIAAAEQNIVDAAAGPTRKMTAAQAKSILKDATMTRLQSSVNALPLPDALDVWQASGVQERKQLRDIINKKIVDYEKRASRDQVSPDEEQAADARISSYEGANNAAFASQVPAN